MINCCARQDFFLGGGEPETLSTDRSTSTLGNRNTSKMGIGGETKGMENV